MDDGRWNELPQAVRDQVDTELLKGRWIHALKALRYATDEPRIGIHDGQDVLMTRSAELREERLHAEAPPRDVATLTDMITAMPRKPAVIEAVWDGDTQGWGVRLCAVSAHPRSETHLALIRHGSAVLLFDNQVPPWPEAKEAEETGRALARHFGVPFHFASPDTPDDKAPRWWPV